MLPESALRPIAAEIFVAPRNDKMCYQQTQVCAAAKALGQSTERTPALHAIDGLKFPAGPGVNALLEPHWEDTVKIALCLIAAIALLVGLPNGIPPAHAETITLKADLKGANEVPPNASPATGKAEAKLDTETRVLTWTVTYADLTGPALGAHFHGPGEQGKNAGIVLPFKTVQSPIEGTATLTETQAADLLAGKWYANIHTQANPGGELRGQMMK